MKLYHCRLVFDVVALNDEGADVAIVGCQSVVDVVLVVDSKGQTMVHINQ